MGFDLGSVFDPLRSVAQGTFDPVSFVDPLGGDPFGFAGGDGSGGLIDTSGIFAKNGVNRGSDHAASELSAAITRQQFNDYQARFMPYLQQLNNMVSPSAVKEQQVEWTNNVMQQYKTAPQQGFGLTQRNLSRYGAAQDPRVASSGMRTSQIDAAANAVAQINSGNQQIKDRGMVLLSGQKMTPDM